MILKTENTEKDSRIYFAELDGLRFFAFLLVFVHHHTLFKELPIFSIFHRLGGIGVDLFFVLSAFLFTKLLIAEHEKTETISFKKFYIRRIFRIWPVYYLFIGGAIFIYIIKNDIISSDIILRIATLLSFTDNIGTSFYGYNPIPFTAHLWTISFEEQFYLIIPIVIHLLVRANYSTKLFCLSLTVFVLTVIKLILIYLKVPHPTIWALPITHFESILFGIIIGFGGFDFMLKKAKPIVLGLFGLILFFILDFLPSSEQTTYWLVLVVFLAGLSTSLILFSVLNSKQLKIFFSQKWLVFLGKRSYGLYLYHFLGNGIATHLLLRLNYSSSNTTVSFLLSLSITIILSIISYKIIETPFLKLKKKFEIINSRPI